MVLIPNGLTPTERRIWDLLMDGEAHPMKDLLAAVDVMADRNSLQVAICLMRRKLGPVGYDVVGRKTGGKTTYRLMRTIGGDDE